MGRIRKILRRATVKQPRLNNRLTIDLCENVHLHYRNLRLEFPPDEFLFILQQLKSLDEDAVRSFPYRPDAWEEPLHSVELPDAAEFDDRLQVEEQMEGHFHLHYRNLRLEADWEPALAWLFTDEDGRSISLARRAFLRGKGIARRVARVVLGRGRSR